MKHQTLYGIITTIMLLLIHTQTFAQRISGCVTDSAGAPIAHANIVEVDINHRIVSSTKSDERGNFNMPVRRNGVTRLRITADGYNILTQRIEVGQRQSYMLTPKTMSRLSRAEAENSNMRRNYIMTEKLLCGRVGTREVPWLVMLEQLGDTTFVLRLPVKASSRSACYREGRCMSFMDLVDNHMLMSYNGEDTTPLSGLPNERSTWKGLTSKESTIQISHQEQSMVDEEDVLYFYPPFILTLDELQHLIKDADNLYRLLIDTEKADNYWIMYPRKNFAAELQKAIDKLGKTQTSLSH